MKCDHSKFGNPYYDKLFAACASKILLYLSAVSQSYPTTATTLFSTDSYMELKHYYLQNISVLSFTIFFWYQLKRIGKIYQ